MPPTSQGTRNKENSSWLLSTRLHLILYSLLLVATPFILLQNYLQEAIGRLSSYHATIGEFSFPLIPVAVAGAVIILVIIFYRRLTRYHFLAAAAFLVMIGTAQKFTDIYFGHHFYDLQQNWHYLAYLIFAWLVDRDLRPRGLPTARIMIVTALAALFYSTFDETFQLFMSSRVFDISDIAKDVWGSVTGVTVLTLGRAASFRELRERGWFPARFRDTFRLPGSTLVLLIVFVWIFVFISSLFTEQSNLFWAVGLSLLIMLLALGSWLLVGSRRTRRPFLGILLLLILGLGFSRYHFRAAGIHYARYGLTVYRGIPIPLVDIMIRPDGSWRCVDKKHFFNFRDRRFLLRQKAPIIIVASGYQGRGGKGFPQDRISQFIYNPFSFNLSQVIILPTPDAVQRFNYLKTQGKDVLLILHSTC